MIRYFDADVVFEEIPDCVSLAVTIGDCPFNCVGCHSDYLRGDNGNLLLEETIDNLLYENHGVNCFLFLGDGKDMATLCALAKYIKEKYTHIKTAVYSGYDEIPEEYKTWFDYIKTGKYVERFGPLTSKTTNQKLYKRVDGIFIDITYLMQERYDNLQSD